MGSPPRRAATGDAYQRAGIGAGNGVREKRARQGDIIRFAPDRLWSDPEKAARKLLEIANAVEPVQEGRIYIEKINAPFLFREGATPAEYKAGLNLAIERG